MEIKITNLTKEFQGVKAVDHITLEMHNGVYGLLGVNGAGKNNTYEDALYTDSAVSRYDYLRWKRYF